MLNEKIIYCKNTLIYLCVYMYKNMSRKLLGKISIEVNEGEVYERLVVSFYISVLSEVFYNAHVLVYSSEKQWSYLCFVGNAYLFIAALKLCHDVTHGGQFRMKYIYMTLSDLVSRL